MTAGCDRFAFGKHQQYTYFQKIEWAALDALGGTTFDLADGLIDLLKINRYRARVNADRYA